ncbi:FlgM family anti-sigma-28 factor [Paenibacillus cellulosilyticus]|uniref:Negative regulator of flagellin synthesis n=1 Tax=Paenibacillus cellulosilyticus TaxID=375489 RepID=A0A2V2Z3H4_9BACL|nr:flagellar biosynthesis anti-sigma factor FlgM [Paenibacillus cellulosilyticus]PWW08360.1 FlgM family anti-sigma-28 factor [Paenibacillus cellulosilyticus]QKS47957.1 flagellar biosynthesis anti-sigma factor FlgM [Paenibacillus cellulosilyticus]
MKINETQRLGAINPYRNKSDVRAAQTNSTQKRDNLQISSEAMEMLQSQNVEGTKSPERQRQLDELKDQVSTGTYEVEAGKLAEKLLPYLYRNKN